MYPRQVVESDPALTQVEPGTFEPVVRVVSARPERRQPIRRRTWVAIGVLAVSVASFFVAGKHVGFDEGAKSRDSQIAEIERQRDEAQKERDAARESTEFMNELHRVEVARTAVFEHFGTDNELPIFNGQVEVWFAGTLVETITDPIVLSPNYGAVGRDVHDEGWQAIVARSPDSTGGVDVFVRNSSHNTYNFIGQGGVVLTDEEVWSAHTGLISFSTVHLGSDVNGVTEIIDADHNLVGMSER